VSYPGWSSFVLGKARTRRISGEKSDLQKNQRRDLKKKGWRETQHALETFVPSGLRSQVNEGGGGGH